MGMADSCLECCGPDRVWEEDNCRRDGRAQLGATRTRLEVTWCLVSHQKSKKVDLGDSTYTRPVCLFEE